VTAAARAADESAEEAAAEAAAARTADDCWHAPAAAGDEADARACWRNRHHRELLLLHAGLFAFVLDEAPGRLAFVSHRAVDPLDSARHGLAGDLGVLHRLGRLDALDRLDVAHFRRRGFGDMDRAADSDRAACRYRGQFRQGRSYRHGLSSASTGIP
jgi:hypothetical protein